MDSIRLLAVLVVTHAASGCGILVQQLVGWNTEETTRKTKTHQIRIESQPPGAQVSRSEGDREPRIIGVSPAIDQVEYQVDETVEQPRAWGLLGTGIAEVAVGAVLSIVGVTTRDTTCAVDLEIDCMRSGGTGYFVGGAALGAFGAIDLIWGITRLFSPAKVASTSVVGEPTYTYSVEKDGVTKSAQVAVPTANGAQIDLGTGEVVASLTPLPPPVIEEPLDARVVAVMDVEDANEGEQEAASASLVRNLSDQLRIFVAQQGVKTIDRSAQDRAFRSQLQALKSESYESCFDDNCQIELGKALAASHLLRSKITKFGSRCVLNGELIDLEREVTIKAASAQGTCQAEGFLEMSAAIARDLMHR